MRVFSDRPGVVANIAPSPTASRQGASAEWPIVLRNKIRKENV